MWSFHMTPSSPPPTSDFWFSCNFHQMFFVHIDDNLENFCGINLKTFRDTLPLFGDRENAWPYHKFNFTINPVSKTIWTWQWKQDGCTLSSSKVMWGWQWRKLRCCLMIKMLAVFRHNGQSKLKHHAAMTFRNLQCPVTSVIQHQLNGTMRLNTTDSDES